MNDPKTLLATSMLSALLACGQTSVPEQPVSPEPQARRDLGKFVLDVDPSQGTATMRVSRQALYAEYPFGEDGNTLTNPPGTIQAVTLTALLPNQGTCGPGQNCFTVQLTNFTGVDLLGVFMAIDSIVPATGRQLLNPDLVVPPGVSAPGGGRNFGNLDDGEVSPILDFIISIPNLSPYQVVGTFWGDDGLPGINLACVPFDQLAYGSDFSFAQEVEDLQIGTAFDGTNYWAGSGGAAGGNRLARHDATGALTGLFQPGIDFRSIFTMGDDQVFAKAFNSFTIQTQTTPGVFVAAFDLFGGPVFDSQASAVWDSEDREIIVNNNNTIQRYDSGTGEFLGSVPLPGAGGSSFASFVVATNGRCYFTTDAAGTVFAHDKAGNLIDTAVLTGAGMGIENAQSFSFANGRFFVTNGDTQLGYQTNQ